MSNYRQALLEEIEFWRELIRETNLSVKSPEYKRMEHALQLAEFKLTRLDRAVTSSVSQSLMA